MPDILSDSNIPEQVPLSPSVPQTEAEKQREMSKQKLRERMADSGIAWIPSEDEE